MLQPHSGSELDESGGGKVGTSVINLSHEALRQVLSKIPDGRCIPWRASVVTMLLRQQLATAQLLAVGHLGKRPQDYHFVSERVSELCKDDVFAVDLVNTCCNALAPKHSKQPL